MDRRSVVVVAGCAAVLAGAVVLRLLIGSEGPMGLGWPEDGGVVRLRLGRVLGGVLVGAGLGVAGALLQNLMRNPLASPDLLGLSSGAGLAVTLAVYWAYLAGAAGIGAGERTLAALVGACVVLALVDRLGRVRGVLEPTGLILVGVAVGIACSALTLFVRQLMPPDPAEASARWLLGSLRDGISAGEYWMGGAAVVAVTGVAASRGRLLDLNSVEEDEAHSLGVSLRRVRTGLFAGAGVLTAAAVALAGPIGFVGLICPHAARLLAGANHQGVVLGSALSGAALVVGSDVVVRALPMSTGRVPIGVVTALVGAPVLVVLLRRGMGR